MTIPTVDLVIDTCLHRRRRWNPVFKESPLTIQFISQDEAGDASVSHWMRGSTCSTKLLNKSKPWQDTISSIFSARLSSEVAARRGSVTAMPFGASPR